MTVGTFEIMTSGGQELPFVRDLREALGLYARRKWRRDTAKQAAKAWGLPHATASNLLKGHASDATVTRVLRAGGWRLASAVVGAVIGQSYDQFLHQELEAIAHERAQFDTREADLRRRYAAVRARRAVGSAGLVLASPPSAEPAHESRARRGGMVS